MIKCLIIPFSNRHGLPLLNPLRRNLLVIFIVCQEANYVGVESPSTWLDEALHVHVGKISRVFSPGSFMANGIKLECTLLWMPSILGLFPLDQIVSFMCNDLLSQFIMFLKSIVGVSGIENVFNTLWHVFYMGYVDHQLWCRKRVKTCIMLSTWQQLCTLNNVQYTV